MTQRPRIAIVENALREVHRRLDACASCPRMTGPPVHGGPVVTRILAVGQAPGPHEGRIGRPFAWTAGRTLFSWMEESLGVDEAAYREHVYMAAVCRCFPGKDKGGGDRKPSPEEMDACRPFLAAEVAALQPRLVLAIGQVAIEQVLGRKAPLAETVGRRLVARYLGVDVDVIALPHPSGASTWFKMEPGRSLLAKALRLLGRHPEWRRTFGGPRRKMKRRA